MEIDGAKVTCFLVMVLMGVALFAGWIAFIVTIGVWTLRHLGVL